MLSADRKVQGESLNQCLLRCHNHLVSDFQCSDGRSHLMNAMKMPSLLSTTGIQGLTASLLQGFPLAFCFTPVTLRPQEGRQCCSGIQEKRIPAHQLCLKVLLQTRTIKLGGSSSNPKCVFQEKSCGSAGSSSQDLKPVGQSVSSSMVHNSIDQAQ